MVDVSIADVLHELPPTQVVGNYETAKIVSVSTLSNSKNETGNLVWVSHRFKEKIGQISEGVVICSDDTDRHLLNDTCIYLLVKNPRLYFLRVVRRFIEFQEPVSISNRSTIDPTAIIGESVTINAGAIIEKDCIVGQGSYIDCNSVLKRGTVVGNYVRVGCNTTIGGVGFGYEKGESGSYELIPHLGNVVIEDFVEIGNNTAIDRAVMGSTLIRKNCKIDNLVHIAHGADIGENSLVIANAMVAGSVKIGDNVWVAPSSSILNQITIGNNVTIGMGAVVLKSVGDGKVIVGNPGKELKRK